MTYPTLPLAADAAPPPAVRPPRPGRATLVHLVRVGLFVAIVWTIHEGHQQRTSAQRQQPVAELPEGLVKSVYPAAASQAPGADGSVLVRNAEGDLLGTLMQTSPQADGVIGFSGPTNVLLAMDADDRLRDVRILWSRDTREHVAQVERDGRFLAAYRGLTRAEAAAGPPVDAVSGATLTSLAIATAISQRLGGAERSLRFPAPLTVEQVRPLFPPAAAIAPDPEFPSLWHVTDESGGELGCVLRTSPAADNIVGYQGPTESLLGLTRQSSARTPAAAEPRAAAAPDLAESWEVTGVLVGRSYDNEPYVGYVREDRYYFKLFTGRTLADLARRDLKGEGVEGVSGATMTSLAVAEGLVAAAQAFERELERQEQARRARQFQLSRRDLGTMLVTLAGALIGLTSLRGKTWVRIPFLILLIGYLGFVNGDLVSQALLVGWASHGVPWRTMPGPLLLTAAALLLPIVTRRNIYCAHLCPHGAAQQLLKGRLRLRGRLGPRWRRRLALLPGLLLAWVVAVAAGGWAFSLVDLEPFDAYVPAIAGWPTLTLFAVSLIASLFVPMAYCQYGCPTGALLNFLRRHGRDDAFGRRDLWALLCLGLAVTLRLVG
jgi:Na+-translocating ferredoxin:NAD+ oxidoreductase RnfG subunit